MGKAAGKLSLGLAIGIALFHLYTGGFGLFSAMDQRGIHLLVMLMLVFLPKEEPGQEGRIGWSDGIFLAAAAASSIYLLLTWRGRSGAYIPGMDDVVFGIMLIAVIIDHHHTAHRMLEGEGAVFAVNILHQDQVDLSNRFAWIKDEERFAAGDWGTAATGAPVLEDALAWLDCTIYARLPAGTHTIYVGQVQASRAPRAGEPPLVYWNRGYRQLATYR